MKKFTWKKGISLFLTLVMAVSRWQYRRLPQTKTTQIRF